jgi:hypothetical protein
MTAPDVFALGGRQDDNSLLNRCCEVFQINAEIERLGNHMCALDDAGIGKPPYDAAAPEAFEAWYETSGYNQLRRQMDALHQKRDSVLDRIYNTVPTTAAGVMAVLTIMVDEVLDTEADDLAVGLRNLGLAVLAQSGGDVALTVLRALKGGAA